MFTFDAITLESVGEMMAFLVDLVGSSVRPPSLPVPLPHPSSLSFVFIWQIVFPPPCS